MKKFSFILMLTLAAFSLPGRAETQSVTLDLPTMNCALCPITVKKALDQVDGVVDASVSYEKKEAVVTFNQTRTSAEELVAATTNAGFPSTIKE